MQKSLRLLKPKIDVSKKSYQEELLLLTTHTLETLSSIAQTCESHTKVVKSPQHHHLPGCYDAKTSLYLSN